MLNDPATHKAISTVAYSTSGVTTAGGLVSTNEIAISIGILCALGTFIVNWIYRAKQNKRDAEYKAKQDNRDIEKHKLDMKIATAQLEQFEQE